MPSNEEGSRCLLIAMPQLMDPNFAHSTSLLSTFNKDGAMGVILNRPLDVTLDKIAGSNVKIPAGAPSIRVYWGGPVQNNLGWIVHEDADLAQESMLIEAGLYLSASIETLKRVLDKCTQFKSPRFRFFLGYAGWGPGQLEQEIAASSWVTAPIQRDLIFSTTPEKTWNQAFASIGVDPSKLAATPTGQAH